MGVKRWGERVGANYQIYYDWLFQQKVIEKRFKVPDRGSVNPTPLGGMGLPRAPRGLACGFPRTGIHLTNGPLSAQAGARYSRRSIKACRNHK